jgi:GH25 family lysozyme M1 (1,4-beta-N-acetylmuramidase)
MQKGYDVSHWAGTINYMQLAYERPDFLIFKASDGNFETGRYREHFDSQLLSNWFYSHLVMPDIPIGVYHWFANGVKVAEQVDYAKFMLDHLDPLPNSLWLDLEEKTPGGSWAAVAAWLQAMMPKMPQVGIYTSAGWLNWADKAWGPRPAWLAQYPLWLASYPSVVNLAKPPAAPPPWQKWAIWQVDKNHKVPGIPGGVSLDVIAD